jgi:hypothetical protein
MRNQPRPTSIDTVKMANGQWATSVSFEGGATEAVSWDWSEARAKAEEVGLTQVLDESEHLIWRLPPAAEPED